MSCPAICFTPATNRVIVEKGVINSFTEKLIVLAQAIKVGNGLHEGVTMGPAVNKQELDGNFAHIGAAQAEGAKLLWGGQRLTDGDLAHGHFMSPAVLGGGTPNMRIA